MLSIVNVSDLYCVLKVGVEGSVGPGAGVVEVTGLGMGC